MASSAFRAWLADLWPTLFAPRRPLAALSESPSTVQYEGFPPPCQEPSGSRIPPTEIHQTCPRPLIGISCYLEQARFGVWDQPTALLPQTYVDSVVAAGGLPVLLPPVGSWGVAEVSRLDGLVLAGGPDIDPVRYGEEALPTTGEPRIGRDRVEFELLDAALGSGVPVLGVCRGMQVLNIALGGTLRQHLPDDVGNEDHLPVRGTFGRVDVKVAAQSRLAGIVGQEMTVSCHHHQGIDRLGDGLIPVAWAPDGSVEAVELPDADFVVGVQWHPEEDSADARLFQALVASA